MEKSTQIKAQLIGQPAAVIVLALLISHYAKRYNIEISSDAILVVAGGLFAWWTNRHVNKTSIKLDTRNALIKFLSGMDDDQIKELTKATAEAQKEGLAGPMTGQTVALAQDVVAARMMNPSATVQDVLERSQIR